MGICIVIAGRAKGRGQRLDSGKLRINHEPERTLRRGVIGAMASRAQQWRCAMCGAEQARLPWAWDGLAWRWVAVAGSTA